MKTRKSFEERKIATSIESLEKQLNAELAAEEEQTALQVQDEADDLLDSDDELDDSELDDDFDDEVIKIQEEDDEEEIPVDSDDADEEESEEDASDDEENLNDEIEEVEEEVEKQEIVTACREVQASISFAERRASEERKGIEDEIGDEANGGDPSVSQIAPGGDDVDVSTDKEVFPTNSEFVAKITSRLDRVATELEKRGMKRMAFRVDQLSDKIESSIRK